MIAYRKMAAADVPQVAQLEALCFSCPWSERSVAGELTNPLGAKLIKTTAAPEGKLIGLDRGYALEMIRASDVEVEYDRLIDRQLERAAITSISGFAKLYDGAAKVLEV